MADIKTQALLYHLTDIKNLESILSRGLRPRCELTGFSDVADPDILDKRKTLKLEEYVPFHFFGGNPFDGGVQLAHKGSQFVLITVRRDFAKANNWNIIPSHPLSDEDIELLDYEPGFEAIDWPAMNARDYSDMASKSVCMAECLSPFTVQPEKIFSIYVKDSATDIEVKTLVKNHDLSPYININPGMFIN